jgi:hypothetical protein
MIKALLRPIHFYGQPSQINVKNAKVRVERSPIFKDRFVLNILGNSVKQNV